MLLLLLVVSIAPGLSILSFVYLRDRYEPEPLSLVGRVFLLGMVGAIPVIYTQMKLTTLIPDSLLMHSFLIASGIEETYKFLLVAIAVMWRREVNEPYDGIVYAVAVSLGFATIENLLKVMPSGWDIAMIRAIFPVPAHALFAVTMGYYLGTAKFTTQIPSKITSICLGLVVPWLFHGIYDAFLNSGKLLWISFVVPFMVMLLIFGVNRMKLANKRSPFRPYNRKQGMKR